ncbi:MAG TPA: DinB family protein [Herpetosiphonaceae bacterium]
MLDYSGIGTGQTTLADLAQDLTVDDLRKLSDEMVDTILSIIEDATDADVVFEPQDPAANDTFSASPDEANIAWTLGHVVVHTTASSEEGAALASSLARGVPVEGRSRYETLWTTVTTIEQVRERLEESRRIRNAFFNTWPSQPHLDVTSTPIPRFGPMDARARFLLGLFHEDSHLEQLREIMRQARAARGA